jgi:hypothetical protein
MASLLVPPRLQIMDDNGEPLVGGLVYTYAAGTTNFKDTYTDYGQTGTNTNPVVLDSFGMGNIWLNGAYKIIVTYPGGDPTIPTDVIYSADNVIAYNSQDFTGLTATIADLNSTTTNAILTSVNYSSTILDRGKVILGNAASAPINIILPSCVTVGNKHQIEIKKIDLSSNYVNIVTVGSQTIDGKYPFALNDYNDFVKLQSDGSNWQIISGRSRGTFITITTGQTITLENETNYFLCDSSSGPFNLLLSPSSTLGNGYAVNFKKIDNSGNSITIIPDGSEQIDGVSSLILSAKNEFYSIKSTGTGWFIISESNSSATLFTGLVLPYVGTTAPLGWIMGFVGTIGDASSGSSIRANADTVNLFALIWNSTYEADSPIYDSSGNVVAKGVTAANDFAAHRRISLPALPGRALGAAGAGTGLTFRDNFKITGSETHIQTVNELVAHTHPNTGLAYHYPQTGQLLTTPGGAFGFSQDSPSGSTGGSVAMSLMQPTVFLRFIIKL